MYKYISPPLDTKNTFKTWRSGATHIKPWSPSCCVLSCLTVLALLRQICWAKWIHALLEVSDMDILQWVWIFGLEESRLSVRPSIRTYGFSEKSAHQIFLIFLMNLWLRNGKIVTVSLFGRKFKIGPFLAKNGPKLAIFGQNSPKSLFFAHIFKLTHQIFLIFLMRPWLYKCNKMVVSVFCWKFKIGPFLSKNDQNLAIFDQKNSISLKFWSNIDSKLFFILFFIWNIFSQVLFQYFRLSCCPMWPNFGPFQGVVLCKMTKNSSKSIFFNRLT